MRHTRILPALVLSLVVCLAASGCTRPNPAYDPDPYLPGECREGVEVFEDFEDFERPGKLDVLLVVDDAGDVEDMQELLAAGVPAMLDVLEDAGTDARVAVATADGTGTPALARPGTVAAGCEGNDTVVASSEDDDWAEIVACNVQQGEAGDPFAQPLRVIERLLLDRAADRSGFFRENARTLVVVVTKDDDCSSDQPLGGGDPRNTCRQNEDRLLEVADWAERMRGAARTPEGLMLAVLSGPPSDRVSADDQVRPVCSSSVGSVFPGNRLFAATNHLGDQGAFHSLCTDDMTPLLERAAERAVETGVSVCPERELVHEPLAVRTTIDGNEEHVPLGDDGFVFLGSTAACPLGALWFAPEVATAADPIEVKYCTPPE